MASAKDDMIRDDIDNKSIDDKYDREHKKPQHDVHAEEKKSYNYSEEKLSSSKSDDQITDEEIFEKLQIFFFEDEALGRHFESFIDAKSYIVDLESNEYKLQYTEVFEEYKALFERRMENFIEQNIGCSLNRVYDIFRKKVEEDENSMESFFVQVLIAVTDFDVFMTMMRESAQKIANSNAHK